MTRSLRQNKLFWAAPFLVLLSVAAFAGPSAAQSAPNIDGLAPPSAPPPSGFLLDAARKAAAEIPAYAILKAQAAKARASGATPSLVAQATYQHAQAATAGVGLANRGGGIINLSGAKNSLQAAYLYWAVDTISAPTAANKTLTVTRLLPTASKPVNITGHSVPMISHAGLCWAKAGVTGETYTVFKAKLTTGSKGLVTGNGSYQIGLQKGAAGDTSGSDPWAKLPSHFAQGAPFPLVFGASLVVISEGSGTVSIYDVGLPGSFLSSFTSYALPLPVIANVALNTVTWHNIGAGGSQADLVFRGLNSFHIGVTPSTELLAFENDVVSLISAFPGPFAAASGYTWTNAPAIAWTNSESDWHGTAGGPIPQLWDDTAHDVTAQIFSSAAVAVFMGVEFIDVSFAPFFDCLGTVANVVEVD